MALGIQHAERKCHIVICGLSASTLRFHILRTDANRDAANFKAHLSAYIYIYIYICVCVCVCVWCVCGLCVCVCGVCVCVLYVCVCGVCVCVCGVWRVCM